MKTAIPSNKIATIRDVAVTRRNASDQLIRLCDAVLARRTVLSVLDAAEDALVDFLADEVLRCAEQANIYT